MTSERCENCGFSETEYVPDPIVLPIGTMLQNRYRIGGVIGQGGFGVTYLAFDMKLGRRIAVKEYFPYGLAVRSTGSYIVMANGEPDVFRKGAEKFYDEARFIANLNSSANIVNVHDVFYENNTVYYVMEYLRGQTIKAYVEGSGRLTSGQAVHIAKEIADALSAAHEINVLHRDISPGNIMLCSDGKIKLIDFGSARHVVSEGSQSLSVVLTQGFAPFEQYQKKGKQGPWSDIYSLGASIYYGLTGEVLDDPITRLDDDSAFLSNPYSIEKGIWDIIKKAVELKPSDRYQSAEELKNALSALSIRPESIVVPKSSIQLKKPSNATVTELDPVQQAFEKTMSAIEAEPTPSISAQQPSPMETMPAEQAEPILSIPTDQPSQPQDIPSDSALQTKTSKSESNSNPKKTKIAVIIAGAFSSLALIAVILVFALNNSAKNDSSAIMAEGTTATAVTSPKDKETTETKKTTTTKKKKTTTKATTTKATTTKAKTTKATVSEIPSSVTIGGKSYKTDMTGVLNLVGLGLKNKDIADLKYMKNVSEIILSDNSLTDLSALSELTQLEKLTYHNNNVKSLSFAKNLKKLTVLGAENNGISDLSPLSGMTKLTEIWLQNNNISDMSPLKKCTNVNSLSFSGNPIKDCSAASGMTKIKNLHLYGCRLKSLEPFKNCTMLEYVNVAENQITDLTPLCGNKRLSELYAANNKLNGNYKTIKGLTILKWIDIAGNGFDDPDELYEIMCYDIYSDEDGFSYNF